MINTRRQPPVSTATLPRLMAAVDDPTGSSATVAEVVAGDAGLAARVLGVANSAQFGLSHRVTRLDLAVAVVGTTMLRTLAIASSSALFERGPGMQELQTHAVRTACASRMLARRCGVAAADAFSCGLLHDIGELLLLQAHPGEYSSLRASWTSTAHQLRTEEDLYGADHATLGAAHLRSWNVPDLVVDAVAAHHLVSGDVTQAAVVVAAAEALVEQRLDAPVLGCVGVDAEAAADLLRAVDAEQADIEGLLAGRG